MNHRPFMWYTDCGRLDVRAMRRDAAFARILNPIGVIMFAILAAVAGIALGVAADGVLSAWGY